nr:DUF448 domain-containing protein [Propionibacterium sp.]
MVALLAAGGWAPGAWGGSKRRGRPGRPGGWTLCILISRDSRRSAGRNRELRRGSTIPSVPERTCVACRGRAGQDELFRFVFASGEYRWDRTRRAPGRGAYLHASCLDDARARRALPRALRAAGSRPGQLEAALAEARDWALGGVPA